ncbi:MAG: MFS transporter [bacterium]
MRLLAPYTQILRHPGAARFSGAAFLARLPISMVGLGIVLMVSALRGSYAEAGAVAAAYTVANALIAPLGARGVDRWGQRPVVTLLVAVHAAALVALVAATLTGRGLAVLLATAVVAGAAQPATGALVRARWAVALGDHPSLRTAFAFESVLDELIFIVGPPLATTLAVLLGAPAPIIATVFFVSVGSALLIVQKSTEPPVLPRSEARAESLFRRPGFVVVLIAMTTTGAIFGSIDVVVVAAADEAGTRLAAGIVLALYAAGSMVSGLVLGARSHGREDRRLPLHFLVYAALLALTTIAFALTGNLVALGIVGLVCGLAVSPVLITAFALTERIAPVQRLTEGLTWCVSAIALGVAIAAAVSGAVVDQGGSRAGFAVTIAAGFATLVAAAAGFPALRASLAPLPVIGADAARE